MLCSVSDRCWRVLTRADVLPRDGEARLTDETSFRRLCNESALAEPLCGVPKNRMPCVDAAMLYSWLTRLASRDQEYRSAFCDESQPIDLSTWGEF
jgi:hypothetical protein